MNSFPYRYGLAKGALISIRSLIQCGYDAKKINDYVENRLTELVKLDTEYEKENNNGSNQS